MAQDSTVKDSALSRYIDAEYELMTLRTKQKLNFEELTVKDSMIFKHRMIKYDLLFLVVSFILGASLVVLFGILFNGYFK